MKKQKQDITPEQLEYLKSKGWIIKASGVSDYVVYIHPKLCSEKHGGYSDPKNALSSQEEQDAYDLGKCYYYLFRDNDYGYTITERSPEGKRRLVFNHHDKDISKEMVEKLRKDGRCDVVIFDTSHVYHKVLILEEKHGNYHYYVPNLPCLFKICRSIVMRRIEEGCWYPNEKDCSEIEKPSLSKEDIEKMKDGPVKRAGHQEWSNYEVSLKYRKQEKDEIEAIKFIKANDNLLGGQKAYIFLKERKGNEYEEFKIEEMEYVS